MNPCSAAAVRRRPTRLLLLAALLFAATVALAAPSSALAAACPNNGTTSWTNPNGGSWDDSANWDNGVPGGSCTVNITTPGNYVVTMAQGGSVAGLTLGGASGTQALEVAGSTSMAGQPQQSLFSIGAGGVAVGTHGVLRYTSVGINPGDATSTGGGTIVNSGLVETDVGTVAGNRDIQNNVTNNVSGVIAFHTSTNTCGCGNTHFWVNHGTITTDSGTANTFTGTAGGVMYSQDGGTFTNNGHAVIAGTVTRTGGTTTGNAIEVCGTLNTPAPGAASFEFDQEAAVGCGGGEIDADVGSGTTITIHNTDPGHSLSVSNVGDFTNNGTIRLDGTTGAAQDVLIGGHVLTNSSTGAIQLAQPGSSQLQMKLVNHGDVHVSAGGTAVSGVSSNDGSETTDAGTSLVFATDFTGSGGTIANAGLFRVGGTFTHTGGNSTGTAINLCGATLHAPGPGTANFEFDNLPGTCSGGGIDGDIGSGDSVRIHDDQSGDHAIGTTGDFANHGILTFDGSGPGRDIIVGGHTITNTGTIQLSQPGSSEFQTSLTNSGTVNVGSGSSFDVTGTTTQAGGTFTVAPSGTFGSNGTVALTGGTVANSGTFTLAGTVTQTGGSSSGNPLQICGGSLSPAGPGTASFQFACAGGGIQSDVGAGDTVSFHTTSGTADFFNATFTNHGTITTDGGGTTQFHNGTLSNDGTITFGGTQTNVSNVVTNSGTINVLAGASAAIQGVSSTGGTTTVDGLLSLTGGLSVGGGTLRGGGTVVAPSGVSNSGGTVHPGHSPGALSITGDYTQTSGGTLAVDVTGTTAGSGYSQLAVSGTATLAGALAVTTSSPQTGTLKIVSAGALTGTFSPVSFTGQTDSVGYDATSVTLSATVSPPPPPPPDPPANTAAPSVSGTTTVGSVLSATQGSWSGSPTSYAYQWRNCDVTGGACADIAGAVGSSYQLSAPDAGHTIRVVVTATGAGGSSAAASGQTGVVTPPPDTTAPVVQAFSASPSTFAVNPAGAPETAVSAKAKRGTTFSYGLSEAARGVFTIERRDVGRRAGAKCVKATHKNRGKKKCTRYTLSGRFAVASSAGKNHHAFSGRIGSKKLTPGSYRVTLVARDPAGNTSAAARTTVTVVSK